MVTNTVLGDGVTVTGAGVTVCTDTDGAGVTVRTDTDGSGVTVRTDAAGVAVTVAGVAVTVTTGGVIVTVMVAVAVTVWVGSAVTVGGGSSGVEAYPHATDGVRRVAHVMAAASAPADLPCASFNFMPLSYGRFDFASTLAGEGFPRSDVVAWPTPHFLMSVSRFACPFPLRGPDLPVERL
ncbi:hypothetical protein ACFYUK_18835 [Nonomuraea wenchangensis]